MDELEEILIFLIIVVNFFVLGLNEVLMILIEPLVLIEVMEQQGMWSERNKEGRFRVIVTVFLILMIDNLV